MASSKKKKEKNRKFITNAAALLNILLIGSTLGFGCVYMTCFEHETKADDENRMLAEFPKFSLKSYLSGDYTEGIANYFDDTVHNRASIKKFIASNLTPLKGRKYGGDDDEGVELYGTAFERPKPQKPAVTTTAVTTSPAVTTAADVSVSTTAPPLTTSEPPPKVDNNADADGELANNILIVNKRGITLYGGAWGNEKEYASFVNAYKGALPDVNVYSLVAPTACSYYMPDKYMDLVASEKDDINSIAESLNAVTPVDAYTALLLHADEPIYSRTDHHWQPLGAYYAAEEFARVAGVPFTPLDQYEKVVLPGYVGTLYGYTQSATLLNNPEDFIYYKPPTDCIVTQLDTSYNNAVGSILLFDPQYLSNSSYYMVFGGDERIVHVQTSAGTGRKLVIFKDSYGNALLPFLTSSFDDIYLCDIRYFDLNAIDFIKEQGATDLLFAMCSYSAVGENRLHIRDNMYQHGN